MKKNVLIICLVVFVLILLIGWFFQKNEIKRKPIKDETTNQKEKMTSEVNQLEIVTIKEIKSENTDDTNTISATNIITLESVNDINLISEVNALSEINVVSKVEEVNHGPTIILSYDEKIAKENPLIYFMYFVPLISPTLVDSETSIDNEQKASVVSYKKTTELSSNTFYVTCEFKIVGKGYHKNIFDSLEMIKRNAVDLKKGETLKNVLDYIKFEGEGFGSIEIKGTIINSKEIVKEVNVKFNARNIKSPVTIGLYSVNSVNGEYKYENKLNEIVARVDTLAFKRSEGIPLMSIKLESLGKNNQEEGFLDELKGKIANFFINPLGVDKFGNETMLDFGDAILKQKSEFTFPKAKNLKKSVE